MAKVVLRLLANEHGFVDRAVMYEGPVAIDGAFVRLGSAKDKGKFFEREKANLTTRVLRISDALRGAPLIQDELNASSVLVPASAIVAVLEL